MQHSIPKPREDYGCGFAESSRNIDQLRLAHRAFTQSLGIIGVCIVPARQTALVGVGRRQTRRSAKYFTKVNVTHLVTGTLLRAH
jgi:hypothetical protein